jgi:EAL domain-containing protein (putative c-di-GMP-specific phosphodiesterase class I)
MGLGLGLSVTVEGVETQVDFAIAREKGADAVQSFIFARAMPPDQVPAWLESPKTAVKMGFAEMLDNIA